MWSVEWEIRSRPAEQSSRERRTDFRQSIAVSRSLSTVTIVISVVWLGQKADYRRSKRLLVVIYFGELGNKFG